jgi:hypothetical protein
MLAASLPASAGGGVDESVARHYCQIGPNPLMTFAVDRDFQCDGAGAVRIAGLAQLAG